MDFKGRQGAVVNRDQVGAIEVNESVGGESWNDGYWGVVQKSSEKETSYNL